MIHFFKEISGINMSLIRQHPEQMESQISQKLRNYRRYQEVLHNKS